MHVVSPRIRLSCCPRSKAKRSRRQSQTEVTRPGAAREAPEITLRYEHQCAMAALANAQDARDRMVSAVLDRARPNFPGAGANAAPSIPFRQLGSAMTWTGGPTSSGTPRLPVSLTEKAQRLERYAASLAAIDGSASAYRQFARSRWHSRQCRRICRRSVRSRRSFGSGQPADRGSRRQAAFARTADRPAGNRSARLCGRNGRLHCARSCPRCAPTGLGMSWIHFRVNAKQVHNAIRTRLGDAADIDLSSRGAIAALRELLAGVEPAKREFRQPRSESRPRCGKIPR